MFKLVKMEGSRSMAKKEDVSFRIESAMDFIDNIFDECDSILKKRGLNYDIYDQAFFSMFRKLIVRWKGVAILIENNQAENAEVIIRTIIELEGCLEFILLGSDIELMSKKVISYEYNSLLERIKVLAVRNKEVSMKAKAKLHDEPVYKQVETDIAKKKSQGNQSKYWANVYSEKKIGHFAELMEYIDEYYNLNNYKEYEGYSKVIKARYKKHSTEIHSNNLEIRHLNFDYYSSEYTPIELDSIMDLLIMFHTLISDFTWYLKKKYNIASEIENNIDNLEKELFDIILKKKSNSLD